ncbi:MAG: SulP family inorganic anion transporter, partial [Solirubrobacteraceae bacterium]
MASGAGQHAGSAPRGPTLLPSLRGYRREWVSADAAAALALLVIAIPEQLATSRLAGMPPVTGYYAFIAGTVLFALLGANPQMSVGADSTIAPLFAAAIGHLAPLGSARYIDLVGLTAVAAGVLVALVWLLRLGWIAEFLSAPIIAGFLAGVGVIIVVHQLPDLLGIASAGGSTLHRLDLIIRHFGDANGWSLGIGIGVFALALASERLDRRLPGALIGLVGSTLLVGVLGLRGHGVAVLGTIAHGPPRFGLHDLSFASIGNVAPAAAIVALVVVSQSAATTR